MEIRNRLFPYPVLAFYNDDYINSLFDVSVSTEIGKQVIKFAFDVNLENDLLYNLIENDDADFAIHIECPSTSFRELVRFSDNEYEHQIDAGKLNGKVQICSFVLAKKEIKNYVNPQFNTYFEGIEFEMERNNILAISASTEVSIEKNYDEIKGVNSIFVVVPNHTEGASFVETSLNQDIIYVRLPIKEFENYKLVKYSKQHVKLIHSLFIIPILVQIFELFKSSSEGTMEDYGDFLWYKSLAKSFKNKGYAFTSEFLSQRDSFSLAQDMADNPILCSIDSIFNTDLGGSIDED
jgi:hypothetical protein